MSKSNNTIFLAYYNAYPMTSGASMVSTSLFKSWPTKKKLFQYNPEKIKEIKDIFTYRSKFNNKFAKLIFFPFFLLFIVNKIKKQKIKFFIIEGASWAGYSYFSFIVMKYFHKKAKFIYHSHNVEYELRKNNFFISKLTFFFEKKILINCDFITAVSKRDQELFKRNYNIKTHLLENGICIKKNFLYKKIHKKNNYIIFPGSLEFKENKKMFNKLYEEIFPILKKTLSSKIKILLTGSDIKFFKNNKDIIEMGVLNKNKFLKYLKSSLLLIIPSSKGPGTKVKIIEALCYNKIVFSTLFALNGINIKYKNNIIYRNKNDLKKKLIYFKKNSKKLSEKFNKIGTYCRKRYDMKIIVKNFYNDIKKKN